MAKLSFEPIDARGARAFSGTVLGGFRACLFYVFYHAGILLDALLSHVGRCSWVPPWPWEAIGYGGEHGLCA